MVHLFAEKCLSKCYLKSITIKDVQVYLTKKNKICKEIKNMKMMVNAVKELKFPIDISVPEYH